MQTLIIYMYFYNIKLFKSTTSIHTNYNYPYASSQIYNYKKLNTKSWDTFFSGIKIKTVPAFRNKHIASSHYHETHFYNILDI